MHIPALDALRHERFGLISSEDGETYLLVKSYVQTDETEERGAYNPKEGFARPFPYMVKSTSPCVIEPLIEGGTLTPLSDELITYIDYLYQSICDEEWRDEVHEYTDEDFSSREAPLASSLTAFAGQGRPETLWRGVYEAAHKYVNRDPDSELVTNPLRDISGRDEYQFDYLPDIEDVTSWNILRSHFTDDTENGFIESEMIWLRYTIGGSEAERPLLSYQNENAGYVASSPKPSFGDDDMETMDEDYILEILDSGDESGENFAGLTFESETKTEEYLQEFAEKK